MNIIDLQEYRIRKQNEKERQNPQTAKMNKDFMFQKIREALCILGEAVEEFEEKND